MGRYINKTPKRHIVAWKDVIWHIVRQNRSTSATCARDEEIKKDKERNSTVQCPDHPRCPIEIPFGAVGGLSAVAISFQFHQHRLSCYWAVRGWNEGWSHYLGKWLMQQHTPVWPCRNVVQHTFFASFSRTTWLSRYQKLRTFWILMKQKRWWGGRGIKWTICTSVAPWSRQITIPALHHSIF